MSYSTNMRIAILYGLFEGAALGRKMIVECTARGHEIVTDVDTADIIVAHSGGWLFLPDNISGKKIVIINASHSSEVSLGKRFYWRTSYDIKHVIFSGLFIAWLREFVIKIWYAFTKLPHWLEMRRRFMVKDITPIIKNINTIVIQSADTSWYEKPTMQQAHKFIKVSYGDHDDCWRRPTLYLKIAEI